MTTVTTVTTEEKAKDPGRYWRKWEKKRFGEFLETAPKGMTTEEFFTWAIPELCGIRTSENSSPGVHNLYDRLDYVFRMYFPGDDPKAASQHLAELGVLVIIPQRQGRGAPGVRIFLAADAPR